MGNSCVGPTPGNSGFFSSASLSILWRPRHPPPPAIEAPPSAAAPLNDDSTHNKPPHPVTIPNGGDLKTPDQASQSQSQTTTTKPSQVTIDSVLRQKTEKLKDVYTLGRKLGQGQFGTTYLCIEKSTGKELACKSIAKRKLVSAEDVEDVRREIQIMHHIVGHPNAISIRGAYEDAVAVHMVMELCTGGELFDRIIQRGHYTEKKAAELARVIVGVVEACHSLGVMHRDLKPENFLFVNQTEDSSLKMIDFGLSIFFKPGAYPWHFVY